MTDIKNCIRSNNAKTYCFNRLIGKWMEIETSIKIIETTDIPKDILDKLLLKKENATQGDKVNG